VTEDVVALARAAYEDPRSDGALNRLPLTVLADALEEAGADADIHGHLRSPGPHVRGCHIIELLLQEASS
jgi:hypothetical protein